MNFTPEGTVVSGVSIPPLCDGKGSKFRLLYFHLTYPLPRTIRGWCKFLWGIDIFLWSIPILKVWFAINMIACYAIVRWAGR